MKLIIISTFKDDQQQLNINTLLQYNKQNKQLQQKETDME